jgi:group I intron endonuclease
MTGIYKITNTKNNKVYIGQSLEILSRWKNHLKIYNNENYALYNRSLYKDMRKYGIENF